MLLFNVNIFYFLCETIEVKYKNNTIVSQRSRVGVPAWACMLELLMVRKTAIRRIMTLTTYRSKKNYGMCYGR